MPFLMIRNDITKVAADAIVNPANRNLLQGSGTSRAIYQAAGEQELTAACEAIGRCDLGRAVCTPAFGLSAKYVFHRDTIPLQKRSEHDIIWIRRQKSPQWCENRFWLFP